MQTVNKHNWFVAIDLKMYCFTMLCNLGICSASTQAGRQYHVNVHPFGTHSKDSNRIKTWVLYGQSGFAINTCDKFEMQSLMERSGSDGHLGHLLLATHVVAFEFARKQAHGNLHSLQRKLPSTLVIQT